MTFFPQRCRVAFAAPLLRSGGYLGPGRQQHSGRAVGREISVLVTRLLGHSNGAIRRVTTLGRDLAGDLDPVADGVVATYLRRVPHQEAVVAHPVRHLMSEPRTALGSIIVRRRRSDIGGEVILPVNAFGDVRYPESVWNAEARMLL